MGGIRTINNSYRTSKTVRRTLLTPADMARFYPRIDWSSWMSETLDFRRFAALYYAAAPFSPPEVTTVETTAHRSPIEVAIAEDTVYLFRKPIAFRNANFRPGNVHHKSQSAKYAAMVRYAKNWVKQIANNV